MELTATSNRDMIIPKSEVVTTRTNFIEANTKKVSLHHLKDECIIPVFSKDNESTISHYQFIDQTLQVARELFPETKIENPNIRVSHQIKGRIPSAIGKPAKELLEHEKTIYYERCAFVVEVPTKRYSVNGNELMLSFGGVRAYNQENLYSRKSLEKFKVFIGFNNMVCTNLCVSTDGFSNEIRVGSIHDLGDSVCSLFEGFDSDRQVHQMKRMHDFSIGEEAFAHFIGKLRMYQFLSKEKKKTLFPFMLNDSQVSNLVKEYYQCPNFGRKEDGSIDLWNVYNLLTEANKSSYIDSNLERNVNAYEFINNLGNSIENKADCWYLSN